MMNMVTFLDFYFIFWIIGMSICCIIFLYLVYDTSFKKFDSLTDTWYFGSEKRHHQRRDTIRNFSRKIQRSTRKNSIISMEIPIGIKN